MVSFNSCAHLLEIIWNVGEWRCLNCFKEQESLNFLVFVYIPSLSGFPIGSVVKNLPASRRCRRLGFDPWVGKIPWRRSWQPIPACWPGKSHGQRSLAGCSTRGHKERHNWATELTRTHHFQKARECDVVRSSCLVLYKHNNYNM